jgi:hypothetical protein
MALVSEHIVVMARRISFQGQVFADIGSEVDVVRSTGSVEAQMTDLTMGMLQPRRRAFTIDECSASSKSGGGSGNFCK